MTHSETQAVIAHVRNFSTRLQPEIDKWLLTSPPAEAVDAVLNALRVVSEQLNGLAQHVADKHGVAPAVAYA